MKSQIAYLMALVGHSERGSIDAYVTKAVMIFLAIGGAVVLITLNGQLMIWVTGLVNSLTGRAIPT